MCEAPVLGIPREMGMCILDPMRWGMKSSPTRFDYDTVQDREGRD